MTRECSDVRRQLLEASGPPAGASATHLDGCAACARFAARRETAQAMFREHHGQIEPDARFAQRVVARLPSRTDAVFGWAVARVLPATLALLLALMWLTWQSTPVTQTLEVPSPTEDVLTWALYPGGVEQ